MDKKKYPRFSGYKNNKIGKPLNIHDKNGNEIHCGDKIIWYHNPNEKRQIDFTGRVLWNPYNKQYEIMLDYSQWYGDDEFSEESYGKSIHIPMDNGAKPYLEIIDTVE